MPGIVILTDYRGTFYSTHRTAHSLTSMDVKRVAGAFREARLEPEVIRYSELNLAADFQGLPVLYTSSEDRGLEYKSWLEDVVLTLEISGARTLPGYQFLRAHHNKVLMEALRTRLFPEEAAALHTRSFGTYEELEAATLDGRWPKVLKSSAGAGSATVFSASDRAQLLSHARSISHSHRVDEAVREHGKRLLRRGRHHSQSLHRRKFIVQDLIPGLAGDFKVLRFGERYYTMWRSNRPNDFRASGSGLFDFQGDSGIDRHALLDYAERVSDALGTPTASMDIGFDGERFHLIEFQCLHFGTIAAEKSTSYFTRIGGRWQQVVEACDIEEVFCAAIVRHLAASALPAQVPQQPARQLRPRLSGDTIDSRQRAR